ncbi:hypothetical protein R3P38DRAFT_2807856 [Favolaschia claudopus]|uniref:Uncharacterized protein n=1 Tax=Favolaschia claudopus TaxID=2862362 RepID=A0AAV9ZIJ3_9AGAR
MPHSSLPPSSPPSSPTRATDDLLDLLQQLSPSKPPDVQRRIQRDIQARTNELRDGVGSLKRRLTDAENQSISQAQPKRQRGRFNRAAQADDSVEDAASIEGAAREAGRHFVVQESLFLVDTAVLTVAIDPDFEPATEFDSAKNRVQGQLLQVMHYLPEDIHRHRTTRLVANSFEDGMKSQLSNTSTRLRGPALRYIVDDTRPFKSSSSRFNAFRTDIGYQTGTATKEPFYSKTKVPILYLTGVQDLDGFLRGPVLLNIYASIIRGPKGAEGLFEGKSKRTGNRFVEKIYKIKSVNTGAIAIWLHSADTQLVEIGDETGINYRERHSYYLEKLLEAVSDEKPWALGLLDYWNHIFFPELDDVKNLNDGMRVAGNQDLENEEDDDDFFISGRRSPSPIQIPQEQRAPSPLPPSPPRRPPSTPAPPPRQPSPTPDLPSPQRSPSPVAPRKPAPRRTTRSSATAAASISMARRGRR